MSVTLHTTHGDIKVELHCEQVSLPSYNFLALCGTGVFTGTPFHRIVRGYIIQCGDPTGAGNVSSAALGKKIGKKKLWRRLPDQCVPELNFDVEGGGVVAYANGGKLSEKGVGSQFFITLDKAPHLNGTCTVVGKVIHGMEDVRRIADEPVDGEYKPKNENGVKIKGVTVHANPFATGEVTNVELS